MIFVTKENQDKPWLMFESGALSKGLAENRICTVLIDLEVRDIDSGSPLRQLNHTILTKDSFFALVKTINKNVENNQVQEKHLETAFNALWESFYENLMQIIQSDPAEAAPRREDADVLNDILDNVLSINKRVSRNMHRNPGRHIHASHAEALVKRLVKMDMEREDIEEALEDVTPHRWVGVELDRYFGERES